MVQGKQMPKVSIITPVFCDISQKIDWLGEMIESVQSQSLVDWELILIDDKSPLPLNQIVSRYAGDKRIRRTEDEKWFENSENNGPAKTRNTAVGLAQSECILPLDADDMLAGPEVLENMYDAWLMDQSKIIYGNLQTYTPVDNSGGFQRNKVIELGQYSLENAMNLNGLIPVTAMHSKACHYKTVGEVAPDQFDNGWKSVLKEGLEDVEYWIAAGKMGFCGQKINHTTLLYRRQENSRAYKLKFDNKQFEAMQQRIKAMHADLYAGRFPVGACGCEDNSAVSNTPVIPQQNIAGPVTSQLVGVDEKLWMWVKYDGLKRGSFAKISQKTQIEYRIRGTGHIFPIHQKDELIFRKAVRDRFLFISDPRNKEPEPKPEIVLQPKASPQITEIPKPQMSTIVRGDATAVATTVLDVQPVQESYTPQMPTDHLIQEAPKRYSLSDLDLSPSILRKLAEDSWTVEDLAKTAPEKLSELPGIAGKRATAIIAKARKLIVLV